MELSGEHRIGAPRDIVWQALNDPDMLARAIPGCQAIEQESDTAFTAKVKTKIGPVSVVFSGRVMLSELDPPSACVITGQGKGGAAGFASGGAKVTLEADGAATILRYTAEGRVGGKLAQVGARLVEGSARKIAGEFFDRIDELVSTDEANGEEVMEEPVEHPTGSRLEPALVVVMESVLFGLAGLALVALGVVAAFLQ